jgi:hypothetical protein
LPSKTWKTRPVDGYILEILGRKGAINDVDLFGFVNEEFEDIGFSDFNRCLMNLEITGRIYVSSLTKGKRRVELTKKRELR